MWDTRIELIDGGRIRRAMLLRDGRQVSHGDIMRAWQLDAALREIFIDLLAAAPWRAFYWETPPVTCATLQQPFECVLLESSLLADVRPDTDAFAEHFDSGLVRDDIVAFPNLGHDALLIAPCRIGDAAAYPHLAAFTRLAPRQQQHALWQRVGKELESTLAGEQPIWVSTAGQGVFWLHVRLDASPKYYNYGPYRRVTVR